MFGRWVIAILVTASSGALAQTGAAPPSPVVAQARPVPPLPPRPEPLRPVPPTTTPGTPTTPPSPQRSDGGGSITRNIDLAVGQVQVVSFPEAMASVLVGLAEVADVTTMTNRTFAITAKKEGYTGIVLIDENNRQFAELIVNVEPGSMSGR